MSSRGRKKDNSWLIPWAFILGVPMFLLMVHPLIFFLVFVPLVIVFLVNLIKWLKK